jgi:hypothetical protein
MVGANTYALPTVDFIGGSTQEIACSVRTSDGKRPFDVTGCTAYFSLINYVNKDGTPIIDKKKMQAELDSNDILSVLRTTLTSADTMQLTGKYIYQITILDTYGNIDVRQGIMYISHNIDRNTY